MTAIDQCQQCGTCCRKGGPALCKEDMALVRQGHILHSQLITIRQGEMGYNPANDKVEPVPVELLKVRGQGAEWACLFLDTATSGCTIYAHRPATCRTLECWQPEPLLATIYKDTLCRRDLINPDDPVLEYIVRQEQQCPAGEFTGLLAKGGKDGFSEATMARLNELIRADLAIREELAQKTGLSVELEFFLLGRPLFKQLEGSGLECVEEKEGVGLRPSKK